MSQSDRPEPALLTVKVTAWQWRGRAKKLLPGTAGFKLERDSQKSRERPFPSIAQKQHAKRLKGNRRSSPEAAAGLSTDITIWKENSVF